MRTTEMVLFAHFLKTSKFIPACISIYILSLDETDKFTLFVNCNFLVLLSTTVCSQSINKQNVNIADKLLQITAFSVGITNLN